MSKRIVTQYPDGTLKVLLQDTRTLEERLSGLSFAEKLEISYPCEGVDEIIKDWEVFDDHKRLK